MSTVETIVAQLRKLIDQANATTKRSDKDTTLAIASLIAGYGAGGGTPGEPSTPPGPSTPSILFGELLIDLIPSALNKEVGRILEFELQVSNVNTNEIL